MKFLAATPILLICLSGLHAEDSRVLAPTQTNVSYGPHAMNVLDFWKAEGDGPRPLLVYIHGGGWVGGDKKLNEKRRVT